MQNAQEKAMADFLYKFVSVTAYWMGYCKEVKGATTKEHFDEALQHLADNYRKIEEAYDKAMEGKVD